MTFIYGLIDPMTGECRYVGKTSTSLSKRLKQHICDAKRRRFEALPRFRWINSLPILPRIVELENCSRDWRCAEADWIETLRREGFRLLNCTNGGDGIEGFKHSVDTRKRMSATALTLASDADLQRRRAVAAKAAASTPEAKAKLSKALKATFAKPEVKARLSAAQSLAWSDPERRAKFGEAVRNRTVSDATRSKISASAKGRKMSPEAVKKMAYSRRGKIHSDETKEKIRAAITPEMRAASAERLRAANMNRTAEEKQKISERMKAIWAARRAEKV